VCLRQISTRGDATLLSLKEQLRTQPIDGQTHVPPGDQHYVYDTRALKDETTLAANGVRPGDTISVVLISHESVLDAKPRFNVFVKLPGEVPAVTFLGFLGTLLRHRRCGGDTGGLTRVVLGTAGGVW